MEVVQGKPLRKEHRVACGIQALAQITEAVVEPNIALYELGSGCSHADAQEQLALFRRIDHTHPQHWADLAMGRTAGCANEQLAESQSQSIKESTYAKTLNRWRASYAACLKIAALELSAMGAEAKMIEFTRWMEEDLCFLVPGVILANRYLAPNANRNGLFKQLRSADRNKALQGVRNQAWDLTLIYAWMDDIRNIDATGRIDSAKVNSGPLSIRRWVGAGYCPRRSSRAAITSTALHRLAPPGDTNGQAEAAVFIENIQEFQSAAIHRLIKLKINRPYMVRVLSSQQHLEPSDDRARFRLCGRGAAALPHARSVVPACD